MENIMVYHDLTGFHRFTFARITHLNKYSFVFVCLSVCVFVFNCACACACVCVLF